MNINRSSLLSLVVVLVPGGVTALLFVLGGKALFGFHNLESIDQYRPRYSTIPLSVHVQKQMFHIELTTRTTSDFSKTIPFVGSSATVNGVDTAVVNSYLNALNFQTHNFGMTGFLAYELPMVKKVLLTSGRKYIVYLYDLFGFGNTIHEQGILRRWNSVEAQYVLKDRILNVTSWNKYVTGITAEKVPLFRYNEFLKVQLIRWATRTIEPLPYPYDYSPTEPKKKWKSLHEPYPLRKLDKALRRDYEESSMSGRTIGWDGFERFLTLAQTSGVTVIVVPAPIMPSIHLRYAQGLDVEKLHNRITRMVDEYGMICIDAQRLPEIPDTNFRDPVHVDRDGRRQYSHWLGRELAHSLDTETVGHH